jgi:hypothetical protein
VPGAGGTVSANEETRIAKVGRDQKLARTPPKAPISSRSRHRVQMRCGSLTDQFVASHGAINEEPRKRKSL